MTYYVAVDIGCIECGESTEVLGIFTDESRAEAVAADHDRRQEEHWHGEHRFEVFEVAGIDVEQRVDYVRV